MAGATFSKGPLRTIDNSEITDISVATSNAFGFVANDRGANREVTYNGFTFPAAVTASYAAANFSGARGWPCHPRLLFQYALHLQLYDPES